MSKHVPGCAVRGALIEGPKAGESITDAAARILQVRCTCRKVLAQAVALVLHPFAGQRLDADSFAAMQSTVKAYLERVGSKYEPIEWEVALTVTPPFGTPALRNAREVQIHLIPPADLEAVEAFKPEAKVIPPSSVPAEEVVLEIEGQSALESHVLVCPHCSDDEGGMLCPIGERLQATESDNAERGD